MFVHSRPSQIRLLRNSTMAATALVQTLPPVFLRPSCSGSEWHDHKVGLANRSAHQLMAIFDWSRIATAEV
jgi:hypothetical protein